MKRLIPLLIVAAISMLLYSCSRIQYVPVESVRVDSISIHDTTVVEKLIPYKDSIATTDTTSFLSNPYAYSRASWCNGKLLHSLGIWPFAAVEVHVPRFIDRYRYIEREKVVEVERRLTRWEKMKQELGGIAMGIIVGIVAIVAIIAIFTRYFKR